MRVLASRRFPGPAWDALEEVEAEWPVTGPRPGVEVLAVVAATVGDELLALLPDLRLVANYGVGYDGIDVEALARETFVEGRRRMGRGGKAVAILGDGALTGGLTFEGLNNVGGSDVPLVVVLNDNEMSISRNVGAVSTLLGYPVTEIEESGAAPRLAAQLNQSRAGGQERARDVERHAILAGAGIGVNNGVELGEAEPSLRDHGLRLPKGSIAWPRFHHPTTLENAWRGPRLRRGI